VKLSGKDLSRYSNNIKSVDLGEVSAVIN